MMQLPVVPEALLARSKKILFITHLAIGDFTYLQTCFKLFSEKYPHIKIDLWIDEVRRTRCFWLWKDLKSYVLVDWIRTCGLFGKIYAGTYSWRRLYALRDEAWEEGYPIVIALCTIRKKFYTKLAHAIAGDGFVVSLSDLPPDEKGIHASQECLVWFEKLFALTAVTPAQRDPFITIPREWMSYAKLKFTQWGIKKDRYGKVVFINAFAKNPARCWPIDRVVTLIHSLQQLEGYEDAHFIVNVEPQFYKAVRSLFSNFCLSNVVLFTAHKNFFQLPAIISLCDLVISVETSVIHLASALKIPVIALMRQKTPGWGPYHKQKSHTVFAKKRRDWVEDISLEMVIDGVRRFNLTL